MRRSHHHHSLTDEIVHLREEIHHVRHHLEEMEKRIMSVLDDLTAQVAATKGTVQSAVTLLDGLAAKIDALIAAGNNDPALQALSDDLKASTQSLADAVARDPRP
jgi:predicted  nucleic acid-binding Zn-ribbon protein